MIIAEKHCVDYNILNYMGLLMKTYFCVICGNISNRYERCIACGGHEQLLKTFNSNLKKNSGKYSGINVNNDPMQKLFSMRLTKYLT